MNTLLIHQNFLGQFRYLGPALVAQGHRVVGLALRVNEPKTWKGTHQPVGRVG